MVNKIVMSLLYYFQLKIGILEENLLKEVHERQLVQQKAEQVSWQFSFV